MNKVSPQADLSGWLSPDEERLLALYRNGAEEERDVWLFRVTRRRLAYMFAEDFDDHRDACDSSYCHEELEQWLREICPRHFLGEYFDEEPAFGTLIGTAWGGAGRVVLGFVERDGQRADELYNAALRLWDMIGRGPNHRQPMRLDRATALKFIESWRKEALEFAYRADSDG